MSVQTFIREIWESRLEYWRRQATVFEGIVNRRYDGALTGVNQTVTIRTPGAITIKDYTVDTNLTLETVTGLATELTVDQQKYWGVKINDVDRVQADVNLMDEYVKDAGYRIALEQDDLVLALYGDVGMTYGTTATPIDITSLNILDTLSEVNLLMDQADLPENDRWAVVSPWVIQKLIKAEITLNTDNSASIANGKVGRVLGFDLRKSNRVPTITTTKYKMFFGYGNTGIAFVNAYVNTKAAVPELQFYEGVLGLHIYGSKVMRPDTVLCLTATKGSG